MRPFCDVIMTLNSKTLKQNIQPKIIFDSFDSYSVYGLPLLEL